MKARRPRTIENGMEVDEEGVESDSEQDVAEGDVVPVTKIIIVAAKELEGELLVITSI